MCLIYCCVVTAVVESRRTPSPGTKVAVIRRTPSPRRAPPQASPSPKPTPVAPLTIVSNPPPSQIPTVAVTSTSGQPVEPQYRRLKSGQIVRVVPAPSRKKKGRVGSKSQSINGNNSATGSSPNGQYKKNGSQVQVIQGRPKRPTGWHSLSLLDKTST